MSTIPESCILLPSLDLDEKEALEIAITNLSKLEHQFTKICSNLDQRLSSLKGKLGGFNQRVGDSRQKVEVLKDVNEAITLVSTSRFPKEYRKHHELGQHHVVNEDFVNNRKIPLLDYDNNSNLNVNKRVAYNANPVAKKPDQNYDDELKKIIRLTRGNFNSKRGLFSENLPIQNQRFRGLGDVPRDIKSIDSLLLFNSKVNPYHNHSPVDNTSSNAQINVPRKKQRTVTNEIQVKDEAPPTLVGGETLSVFETNDSKFRPSIKPVPEIVGPSQLGLRGIVKYGSGSDEMDNFMPSRGGTVKKPTLPDPEISTDPADKATNLLDPSTLSAERFSHVDAGRRNSNIASQQNLNVRSIDSEPKHNNNQAYRFAPVISQAEFVALQDHPAAHNPTSASQQLASSSSHVDQPKPHRPEIRPNPSDNSAAAEVSTPVRDSTNTSSPSLDSSSSIRKENESLNTRPKPSSSREAFLQEIRNPSVKLVRVRLVEKEAPSKNDLLSQIQNPPVKLVRPKPAEKATSARDDFLNQIRNPSVKLVKAKPVEKEPVVKPLPDAEEHLKKQIRLRWEQMHKHEEKRRRREELGDSDDDDNEDT